MNIKVNVSHFDDTLLQLAALALPPKKRARAMWRIADSVRNKSKTNAKQQRDPDGSPWQPIKRKRKGGKQRDKMFRTLPKYMKVSKPKDNEPTAKVYFQPSIPGKGNYSTGVIANMHAQGVSITRNKADYSAAMARYEAKKGLDQGNATRNQARFLVKLGMRRRVSKEETTQRKKRGAYVRATASWITANLSYIQAGFLITELNDASKSTSQTWNIKLPKRNTLGATEAEQNKIFKRVMQGINYGWTVKKQDIRG